MGKFYSINGEIMGAKHAKLHVSDLSILRGFGVFDFFRTSKGKLLFIDDYLARFRCAAQTFHFSYDYTDEFIKSHVLKLIELNGYQESSVKLIMTGGYSHNGFEPATPNLIVQIEPLKFPDERYYTEGAKLITHKYVREFPEVKSTNYLTAIMLSGKCKAENALDVLYHNGDIVSEVSRSNFFVVKGKKIITAKTGILKGITRGKILKIAEAHYKVEERDLLLQELEIADEAFITSTNKRVMPISRIDNHKIGDGNVGKVTKHLMDLFLVLEERQ